MNNSLDVLCDGAARLGGVGLLCAEVVERRAVDPLAEGVLCHRLLQHLALQQAHPAVKQSVLI